MNSSSFKRQSSSNSASVAKGGKETPDQSDQRSRSVLQPRITTSKVSTANIKKGNDVGGQTYPARAVSVPPSRTVTKRAKGHNETFIQIKPQEELLSIKKSENLHPF